MRFAFSNRNVQRRVCSHDTARAFLLTGPSGCLIPHVRPPASVTGDHAFITYQPAEKNDKKLRLAVKDSIDMKGEKTTVGSEFLAVFGKPATDDAKCLATARKRGDVEFVGKTNLSELAVATSGVNAYFGTPRNPLRHSLIPGGSSSGSAVAVAKPTWPLGPTQPDWFASRKRAAESSV